MTEIEKKATADKRPYRTDTVILQWIRIPLLIALSLVIVKAIERPLSVHATNNAENVATVSPPIDVPPFEELVSDPPTEELQVSAADDVRRTPDLVAIQATSADVERSAKTLGATIQFVNMAFRDTLRQLSQTGAGASYPLRQASESWTLSAEPWDSTDSQWDSAPPEPEVVVVAASPDSLVLANPISDGPSKTTQALQLLLDDQIITLAPGTAVEYPAERSRLVRFHRGGTFGAAREEVTSGVYVFQATAEGWRLTQRETLPSGVELTLGVDTKD